MTATLISLGANLGDPRESMRAAKRLLSDAFGEENLQFSRLARTPPVGGPTGQGDFLNAMVALQTNKSAWEVWEVIKRIETILGRQRQHRWEARRIDIDLILFGEHRIWTPHLKVPHPRMCMRTFVLQPACEVAGEWIDPVTCWSLKQLASHLESCETLSMRVICPDHSILTHLRDCDALSEHSKSVRWCSDLESGVLDEPNPFTDQEPLLTIVAVASPDPMTVLWEDYSSQWASRLSLSARDNQPSLGGQRQSQEISRVSGPRYLMPANDLSWAAHEIRAAFEAMACKVEALESF